MSENSTYEQVSNGGVDDFPILSEDEYKRKRYYEYLNEKRAWEARCSEAAIDASRYYEQHPAHKNIAPKLLEDQRLTQVQRQRVWAAQAYSEFVSEEKFFSPAAVAVVHSYESAAFFDDIKCDYLGASDHFGFREISPRHNATPFDVQFHYDVGVLNAYSASGNIIHIRETSDPSAKSLEQKLFIVAMNVFTCEVQRLYAENDTEKSSSYQVPHHFDETYVLKQRALQGLNGQVDLDSNNPFAPIYQKIIDDVKRSTQASLTKSAQGRWLYKSAGVSSGVEALHSVRELDRERHLLGQIALQTGLEIGDRGVVLAPGQPHLSIAS